jgi:hypothetical protein
MSEQGKGTEDVIVDVVTGILSEQARKHLPGDAEPWIEILAQLMTLGAKAAVAEALRTRMSAKTIEFSTHD